VTGVIVTRMNAHVDDARMPGPLVGVRVVELGVMVAGPAAGGVMADWGADVIKIESPTGDPLRHIFKALGTVGDMPTPPFEMDNRGKRSVTLDVTADDQRATLLSLIADADVFLTNVRLPSLVRLGLDPESLTERFPNLIYALLTGYGQEGADAARAGYDVGAFWARSGLAQNTVPLDAYPSMLGGGVGDHVTAITLVSGIAAALFDRTRTGRGRLVHTSLLRAGLYANSWTLGVHLRFGRVESARHREDSRTPLINPYRTGDGRGLWLLGLEADRHWPNIVRAIGREDLFDDPRFATATSRKENGGEIVAMLDEVFARYTRDELTKIFDEHDVWWAPINTIADALEDPQVLLNEGLVDMTPREGDAPFRAANSPIDFGGYTVRPGAVRTALVTCVLVRATRHTSQLRLPHKDSSTGSASSFRHTRKSGSQVSRSLYTRGVPSMRLT